MLNQVLMSLLNKSLKPTYKVWVYTSSSEFNAAQIEQINQLAHSFTSSWESHGDPVIGGIEILYNRFVFIYADDCDGHLCGRAQDAQVRFIKELESNLNLELLNRMNIAYKMAHKSIEVLPMTQFSALLKTIENSNDLIVYDNTVANFSDFETKWELPIAQTWMARLLN